MKYAVVGTLRRAGGPLTIAELTEWMRRSRPVDEVLGPITPKRLSDVLRAQVRSGRVRRIRRGTYEAVSFPMGRTTAWRYDRWEVQFDRLAERQRRSPGRRPRPGRARREP